MEAMNLLDRCLTGKDLPQRIFCEIELNQLVEICDLFDWAVSMTTCKKRSMMLFEIESVRGEQLSGAPEAQRLARSSVQFPGNG